MITKNLQVANFNVVFGDKEEPMLNYFDDIVYPALISGIVKKTKDGKYLIKDVEIIKDKKNNYILKGIFIKQTHLLIKSDLNEYGELIEKDEEYSTAPYSLFAINLLNHRMVFMPNQKGSPTLSNFKTTVQHLISTYIKNNKAVLKCTVGYALVNVVGIPSSRSMDEMLKKVKKIKSLKLSFFPLNGDLDFSAAFDCLFGNMRETVGSNKASLTFNSPKNIEGVKAVIEQSGGYNYTYCKSYY